MGIIKCFIEFLVNSKLRRISVRQKVSVWNNLKLEIIHSGKFPRYSGRELCQTFGQSTPSPIFTCFNETAPSSFSLFRYTLLQIQYYTILIILMVERFNFSEYFDIRTFNKHRKYLYVNIDRREELEN